MKFEEVLSEKKSKFQHLQDNKVALTPEERKECIEKKAVWHLNGKGPTPAVWKSKNENGDFVYITNTHRAYQVRPTLKGAISIFHKFIKRTA